MKSKILIWAIIIIHLTGCEEEIDWQLQKSQSDLIVVEAILTNENKNQLIRLSRPFAEQNMTPEPVSGAIVTIKTSDGSFSAREKPVGTGLYFTDSLTAVVGKLYTIVIDYNSFTYFANAIQTSGEGLEPISYQETSNNHFTLDFTSSGTAANYIKYFISWKESGNCSPSESCEALQIYYDLKNVDVHEQFKPDQEIVEFPEGTIIIRKKYSVSNDYREYLRGMLSETSWRGGVFDVFPANAATNLSNGAVGFVAISTVVTVTTIITL